MSVLRTCRQIHEECKDLLWKYNTLKAGDTYPISLLSSKIKNKAQSVKIRWDFLDMDKYRDPLPLELDLLELASWPSLRSLKIQAWSRPQRGGSHGALQTFAYINRGGRLATGPPETDVHGCSLTNCSGHFTEQAESHRARSEPYWRLPIAFEKRNLVLIGQTNIQRSRVGPNGFFIRMATQTT